MEHPTPRRVAVLAGGHSGEAEVSRKSAAMVMANMDRGLFAPVLVHIDVDGWWCERPGDGQRVLVDPSSFSFATSNGQTWSPELAFVIVHGTPGEDGILQRSLEAAGIPHTTASSAIMALTFHKGQTTRALREAGLPVAASAEVAPGETGDAARQRDVLAELGLPVFVKPNEAGSSLGISKVNDAKALWPAIDAARAEDGGSVLVEANLKGREFTCGVIPDGAGGLQVLPVTEIVTENEFFDYAAKYEGQSQEITPALLDERDTTQLQSTALRVYETLHLRGMARVDMMMVPGEPAHVIEINGVPGFSEASIVPLQAAKAGLDKRALVTRLLQAATL